MSLITPGKKFIIDGVEYKVLRPNKFRHKNWTCLYYQGNSGKNKEFSSQEILKALRQTDENSNEY